MQRFPSLLRLRSFVARLMVPELRMLDARMLEIERRLTVIHEYIEDMDEDTLCGIVETELCRVVRIRVNLVNRITELEEET